MTEKGRRSRSTFEAGRSELRLRRQRAILETALHLVATEGHESLTMQRLAGELECGVGSLYRLFASKDALLAEMQHEALDVLHAAWQIGLTHLDDAIAGRQLGEADAALVRAVGSAWFWVVAEDRFPHQIDLSRRLFVDRTIVVPDEQASMILPAALRLLDLGRNLLDAAVDTGALRAGDGMDRAVRMVASVTGIVLTGKFGRWDQTFFDGRRLALESVREYFVAWGAEDGRLDVAEGVVREVAASGRLAPAIDRDG